MDFALSEEQLLLERTVRSFLADRVPIERVRELREKDCPNDRAIWSALAELGVTGVLVPEGQTRLDADAVGRAVGRGLESAQRIFAVPRSLAAPAASRPAAPSAGRTRSASSNEPEIYSYEFETGAEVQIGRSEIEIPLVRFAGQNFFGTLQRKLNWAARPSG